MSRPPDREGGESSIADAEIESFLRRADHRTRAYQSMPSMSSWSKRMDRYPQLSAEAQNELALDHQRGQEATERLRTMKRRGTAAERKARAAVRRGDYAMEHLVGSNFRLVTLICREKAEERFGKERANEMLVDLIAEANTALTEAANKFDPERGPAFNTYAARVVRDRVRMVLSKDTVVSVPPAWRRLKRIASVRIPQLSAELGREPTRDEIRADLLENCMEWAFNHLSAAQRNLDDAGRREAMLTKLRKQGMLGAIERIDDVLLATQSVSSLDAPVGDEGSSSLSDVISDGGDDVSESVAREELRDDLMAALAELPERDRDILMMRHGFTGENEPMTYAAIAPLYEVTPERIRQIETAALARLRMPDGAGSRLAAHLGTQFED